MHILPLSWRRSIRSLLATGCVLAGVSPAVSADLPVGTDAQLRNAIVSATSGDTITFTNNIILTTGDLPLVQRNVTIRGQNFTLSGNNQFRGLFVAAFTPGTDTMIPVTVGIQDLTIQNTKAQGGLGGNGGFAGGGGGAGLGGAIFVGNLANVTLTNVALNSNNASGGVGGIGSASGAMGGGGGLGGNGGSSAGGGGAGGGGLGRGANGADNVPGSIAGTGIAIGAASGGNAAAGGTGGGPSGGGGGGGGGPGGAGGGGGVGGVAGTAGVAGTGGYGGGGGSTISSGANGGFGGGGAGLGAGGFGGGGGGRTAGGFGGGTGSNTASDQSGGGGAGLGGALFVQQGGNLTVTGNFTVNGNKVDAGIGGGLAANGSAFGDGLFLQGNGSMAFNPANGQTQTIANAIADQSGSGGTGPNAGTWALTKNGAGTLILRGANTYRGLTTVNDGTFTVNGSIAGDVLLNGGTLGGSGSIGTFTANNGNLAPGNSIGTLTVNGNFIQNAASTYQVELNAGGQSDLIAVNGTATINGARVNVNAAPGTYNAGQRYTILTATGGVTGQYSAVTDNLALFDFRASTGANDVQLEAFLPATVVVNTPQGPVAVPLGFNQNSTLGFLSGVTLIPGSDFANVINQLQFLDLSQSLNALDQISGTQHASLLTVGRLKGMYLNQLLADQIRSTLTTGGLGSRALARGAEPDADETLEVAAGMRTWLKAYGLGGQVESEGGAQRFVYSFVGMLGGIERRLTDTARVGIVGGYNHTNADFRNVPGSADGEGFLVGLYGTKTFGQGYLLGSATYGYTGYDTRRLINFAAVNRQANGDVDQNDVSGYLETGFTRCIGWARIQPMLGAQYFYLNQNGFTETGAGALNLAESSQSTRALWGMAGARVFLPLERSTGFVTPNLHARYVHDFIGENQFVSGSLAGAGGSFLVKGAGMGRNFLVTGGGVSVDCNSWLKLVADYTLQTNGNQTSHTGSGSLQIQW